MHRSEFTTRATTSGVLLASALTPLAVAEGLPDAGGLWELAWPIAAVLSGGLSLAGLSIVGRPRFGCSVATLAIFGTLALSVPHLLTRPFTTLAVLVSVTLGLALLWRAGAAPRGMQPPATRPLYEGQAQGAAIVALTLWAVGVLSNVERSPGEALAMMYGLVLVGLLAVEWAWRRRRHRPTSAGAIFVVVLGAAAWAIIFRQQPWWATAGLAAVAVLVSVLVRRPERLGIERTAWWEPLLGHPERLLVGTFLTLSLCGTVLLALPHSASSGRSIGILDAAFTSTSAVCVTGLIVLDTPVDFSVMGQVIILLLIQVGGLGIMTFSTATLWALGQRMSLRHETAVASLESPRDRSQLYATARGILVMTCVAESVGALILSVAFWAGGDTLASSGHASPTTASC